MPWMNETDWFCLRSRVSGRTYEAIAEQLGVVRERVRQRVARLMAQIAGMDRQAREDATCIKSLEQEVIALRAFIKANGLQQPPSTFLICQSIDELELSVRTYNVLKSAGIDTVGQLLAADLATLRRCGRKASSEIEEIKRSLIDQGTLVFLEERREKQCPKRKSRSSRKR